MSRISSLGVEVEHWGIKDDATHVLGHRRLVEKVSHNGATHTVADQDEVFSSVLEGKSGSSFEIFPFRQAVPVETIRAWWFFYVIAGPRKLRKFIVPARVKSSFPSRPGNRL